MTPECYAPALIIVGAVDAAVINGLQRAGVTVHQVSSLFDGEALVVSLLNRLTPSDPLGIVLAPCDYRGNESWLLSAVLTDAMITHRIRPTRIVTLADGLDPSQRHRIELTGSRCVLTPYTEHQIYEFLHQVLWTPIEPDIDAVLVHSSNQAHVEFYVASIKRERAAARMMAISAYHHFRGQLNETLQFGGLPKIDPESLVLALRLLTTAKGYLDPEDRDRGTHVLLGLGGPDRATALFKRACATLESPDREGLTAFLEGCPHRTIAEIVGFTRADIMRRWLARRIAPQIAQWFVQQDQLIQQLHPHV